jgi:DNA invertase Pin-like site-specific DNA recombinase
VYKVGSMMIGYTRVSTEEQSQSGAGLEAQRSAIEAEAQRRGWEIHWVSDDGYSAKNLRRPGIQAALAALKSGQAEGLVVAKLDRLSRSLLDFATLMNRAQREGWKLVALDLGVDTASPSGEMMANVLASFAQFERRLIGERTKNALAVRRKQGVRLGRPTTVPASVQDRIQEQRGEGLTYRQIAQALNRSGIETAHGGRQWHASTVRAVERRVAR